LQGVASFLDAISVGFVFYYYGLTRGLLGCLIMTIFGFIICKQGFFHGKHFGVFRTQRGYVYAGIIMILVGIELFIKGVFM
jgi:putative Mn2+ efflux pump MntP